MVTDQDARYDEGKSPFQRESDRHPLLRLRKVAYQCRNTAYARAQRTTRDNTIVLVPIVDVSCSTCLYRSGSQKLELL